MGVTARYLGLAALAAPLATTLPGLRAESPGRAIADAAVISSRASADELVDFFEADRSQAEYASRYREGFDAFIERMDAFDGPGAVRLARALHRRADGIWSAFCLEGALRRSATEDTAQAVFAEADAVLVRLLDEGQDGVALERIERVDVLQRRAILAAGFGRRSAERAMLGAALAERGVDGAQITGLAALEAGDMDAAARLFGSLLDSAGLDVPGPGGAGGAVPATNLENAPPWALRGHGLAVWHSLTGTSR